MRQGGPLVSTFFFFFHERYGSTRRNVSKCGGAWQKQSIHSFETTSATNKVHINKKKRGKKSNVAMKAKVSNECDYQ